MTTNIYVDGFNLYYGALKGTPYKWLNLERLGQLEFPNDRIQSIHYFTALVKNRSNNPAQSMRQHFYLRALRTLPDLTIWLGHYLESKTRMPYANPPPGGPATVEVFKSEEKGSDVNLATRLLVDAFDGAFEKAVIVSNDSDLAMPVEVVRQKFGKPVAVLFPCRPPRKPSFHLSQVASASPILSTASLAQAQFPDDLTDAQGAFHKPANW